MTTGDTTTVKSAAVDFLCDKLTETGAFAARRRGQQVKWMWAMFDERLRSRLTSDPRLKAKLPQIERAVAEGSLSPALAVDEIAEMLGL